jgi:hypothetical protein
MTTKITALGNLLCFQKWLHNTHSLRNYVTNT